MTNASNVIPFPDSKNKCGLLDQDFVLWHPATMERAFGKDFMSHRKYGTFRVYLTLLFAADSFGYFKVPLSDLRKAVGRHFRRGRSISTIMKPIARSGLATYSICGAFVTGRVNDYSKEV